MEQNFSHYTLKELCEMSEVINRAIEQQRMALRGARFDDMMRAINAFAEVCPDAQVFNFGRSCCPIRLIADPDQWEFARK